jgi:hypothetical protein
MSNTVTFENSETVGNNGTDGIKQVNRHKDLFGFHDFLMQIRMNYPNVYSVIISVATVLWFKGIYTLIDSGMTYYNFNSIDYNILILLIALYIFYMNDYTLNELYDMSKPGSSVPILVNLK